MSHAVEDAPYALEATELLDAELAASCRTDNNTALAASCGSDNPHSISVSQAASCGDK